MLYDTDVWPSSQSSPLTVSVFIFHSSLNQMQRCGSDLAINSKRDNYSCQILCD